MPIEKFHGIITRAEMERALKYKPVSWYSLPSEILTSLSYKVSVCFTSFELVPCIYNWALNVGISSLISKYYGFASYDLFLTMPYCLTFLASAQDCCCRQDLAVHVEKVSLWMGNGEQGFLILVFWNFENHGKGTYYRG
jgi:hypothetical protein